MPKPQPRPKPTSAKPTTGDEAYAAGRAEYFRVTEKQDPKAADCNFVTVGAVPPPIDLLREHVYTSRMPANEVSVLRAEFLARILESLMRMRIQQLQEVAQFADLCENDQGSTTPAEAFITGLVCHHYHCGGLTPEAAIREIESPDGFRINFEEIAAYVQRCAVSYPRGFAWEPAAAKDETQDHSTKECN